MGDLGVQPASVDGTFLGQLQFIIGIIMAVGSFVAVGAGIYLGIKYMLSSVEEKAEIKKKLVPFIIGLVIFYGATGIISIISKIAELIK